VSTQSERRRVPARLPAHRRRNGGWVRVTIGRARNGRNSNVPSPECVSSSTTAPFVSGASANDVRSTDPA
jgi:hypothetical protein